MNAELTKSKLVEDLTIGDRYLPVPSFDCIRVYHVENDMCITGTMINRIQRNGYELVSVGHDEDGVYALISNVFKGYGE